jgi:hypothetical protein
MIIGLYAFPSTIFISSSFFFVILNAVKNPSFLLLFLQQLRQHNPLTISILYLQKRHLLTTKFFYPFTSSAPFFFISILIVMPAYAEPEA